MDSFFGKNGTLQDLMYTTDLIGSVGQNRSSGMNNISSLGSLVSKILALLA